MSAIKLPDAVQAGTEAVAAVLRKAGITEALNSIGVRDHAVITKLQAGADKGPLTIAQVDEMITGLSVEKRITAKAVLAQAGLMESGFVRD